MKTTQPGVHVVILGVGLAVLAGCANQPKEAAAQGNVLAMQSVPEGHYLANLQLRGQEQRLNFEVQGGFVRCVNSTDAKLKGIQGRFACIGNGVFSISLQGDGFRATQFWLFRPDGSAVIKEIPDRGEQQKAIPVKDDLVGG